MAPRPPRRRRPHADPIGLALGRLAEREQVIVVASGVCGLDDQAVVRVVGGGAWRWRSPDRSGCRFGRYDPAWWIAVAIGRFGRERLAVELDVEADRRRIVVDHGAYGTSACVRAICARHDVYPPGVQSHRVQRCVGPDCDATWAEPRTRRSGRPRRYCGDACRQRAWRRKRARQE
jgi:hypothetical protein